MSGSNEEINARAEELGLVWGQINEEGEMGWIRDHGITIIEGRDLEFFLFALGLPKGKPSDLYRIRIWHMPDGSIKIKANERTWTWTIGRKEPS